MWVRKFCFEDVPQPNTGKLKDYVTNYSKQKKKAVLLHGPPGSGKTSAVHALVRDLDLEMVEVNASDYRTADEISSRIGNAVSQHSLFGGSKLIFIDEVDGVSGKKDRGAVKAIIDIISKSRFPVIIAANDAYDDKLKSLRSKCLLLDFPSVSTSSITAILRSFFLDQQISVDEPVVKAIARRSGGDLRGAIIDAEVLGRSGRLSPDDVYSLSDRERSESIMQALVKILKSTDPVIALSALDGVDEDLDQVLLWLDENLPKEYEGVSLARAYDKLSRADVFRGRIRRWQYWRFLAYVNQLITAGVAVSKDEKKPGFVQYERNKRLLKIWMANRKYAKRKAIAEKLGVYCHCSARKALDFLPLLKPVILKDPVLAEGIGIDDEELGWLQK